MSGADKKLVFVSYAHEDDTVLKRKLLPFLKDLELGEEIELWHDRMIGTGEDWYAEIADRLDNAKVAILFVTQEFLSSRFCRLEEVPVLLQRARRGELQILPLLVEDCLWKEKRWLSRLQMWPEDGKALDAFRRPGWKRVMTEFARRVLKAVNAPAEPDESEGRFDAPHPTHDLHRMPQTGSLLFGRRREIKLLDDAWNGGTNIVAFTAGGGVGKSTLARVWAEMLAEDDWRGAERAFAWSFYSQGTGRMTDAEGFINEALAWFGDDTPIGLSLWDRAERLANYVRKRRTLLLLDGVEPLQSGDEGVDQGSIRDPGLRTLLEELAKDNPGLCVVTTREPLVDLEEYGAPAVLHQDLDQVSTLAGRALLRVNRIRGEDADLEATVGDLGRHALAVSLLGNLLTDEIATPHISTAKTLPKLAYPVEQGGHPRRVLDAWAKRLGDGAALELLHIIGLFDRPAARSAVQAVIDGDLLPGLTTHLRAANLDGVLARLRTAGLLARQSLHEDTIDAHPIVREHFGQRLNTRHPNSWREGHRRLYEHYKNEAEHRPNDLAGMQPLFAAVAHGCAARLYQEVLDEVYNDRIVRRGEGYLVFRLGAFAADLSCLSHFFAERWNRPEPTLSSTAQSWIIGQAGFRLRALGRLREAVGPMAEALSQHEQTERWSNAAVVASNLSHLYLVLGEVAQADTHARDAVDYADRSGDLSQRLSKRSTHAGALHQLGRTSDARVLFVEAERMQAELQHGFPILYSLRGYQYCDLLLAEGEADEVVRRAEQTLEWVTPQQWLLAIALDHISLGRAHMATFPPDLVAAEQHLRVAVDGLRASGQMQELPRGLLARAAFHRSQGNLAIAQRDLNEVRTIVRRTGMRLYEADLELEQARWHVANGDADAARQALDKARDLVEDMNYGRRRPEVADLDASIAALRSR
ncbi:MAG: TIR domain-containing protein [Bacteroidota bacterium]